MSRPALLNVTSYIDAFGGREQVINRMRKRFAVDLTKKQVEKWVERQSIPGSYLVALQIIGDELKPNIKILDHIQKGGRKK